MTTQNAEGRRLDEVPEILDVIERLCKLIEEVSAAHGHERPTDCFCTRGGFWKGGLIVPYHWRHDPEASVAFVERATRLYLRADSIHRRTLRYIIRLRDAVKGR